MVVPQWVRQVIDRYDAKTEPHNEVTVADALRSERNQQGNLSDQDWKGFLAEHSVFLFRDTKGDGSTWGTYFAPMWEYLQGDKTVLSPDIAELDAETITHWEKRAATIKNPMMKARYADAAWDLANAITKGKPNYKCAQIAIDAYIEATERHFYTMEIEPVKWLVRALHLARSIADKSRASAVVDAMFRFYEASLRPKLVGVWIFLFDNLYGEHDLISESQEAKIVADLERMLSKLAVIRDGGDFDPYGAQAAAERLAHHYKQRGDRANVERVIKTYGEAFVALGEEANSSLAMAWLQPVIERYEQEGMKDEAEKLRLMQIERGKNVEADLKYYSVSVDITKKDYDDAVAAVRTTGDLAGTLGKIAHQFLPSAAAAKRGVERMKTATPLLSMIPIKVVDRTGRPVATIGTDEDSEGRLLQELARTIGFFQSFLSYTISAITEEFRPTTDDIIAYLYESPLFLESRRSILREGLAAYLSKDHLKAIHILVPQIEEMLRTLLVLMGIPPQKSVRGHPGITDVKNMNDALGDTRVQAVLTENVWRYLTVLYVDKRGFNVRNDLAHGLMPAEAFNQSIADLVFHSLLVLSLMRARAAAPPAEEPNP
jgi:hypothetical protein